MGYAYLIKFLKISWRLRFLPNFLFYELFCAFFTWLFRANLRVIQHEYDFADNLISVPKIYLMSMCYRKLVPKAFCICPIVIQALLYFTLSCTEPQTRVLFLYANI